MPGSSRNIAALSADCKKGDGRMRAGRGKIEIMPPGAEFFASSNIGGGDEINAGLIEKYRGVVRGL